jgi:hypothetical protein
VFVDEDYTPKFTILNDSVREKKVYEFMVNAQKEIEKKNPGMFFGLKNSFEVTIKASTANADTSLTTRLGYSSWGKISWEPEWTIDTSLVSKDMDECISVIGKIVTVIGEKDKGKIQRAIKRGSLDSVAVNIQYIKEAYPVLADSIISISSQPDNKRIPKINGLMKQINYYGVTEAVLGQIFISKKGTIVIDQDDMKNDAVHTTKAMYTRTTAHEVMHLYHQQTNKTSVARWSVIRDWLNKHPGVRFYLCDDFSNNNACSKGTGHERNNPENTATCNEGNNY